MTDRIGLQLGNYRLIRQLERGGFAEVYLAEHIHLNTQFAIKVLISRLTGDEIESFQTEARTIAGLVHPHIVRVLNFGLEAGTPYLVMEYASRGSLRQRHPKGSRVPLPTIVSYVNQAAEALQYAHHQKIIHRDVKPENMLLGSNDEILISDFGLAVIAQSSDFKSAKEMPRSGTLTYMAPEQLQGKLRLASDQYALAIIVYEWLCGSCPFSGDFTEIFVQHLIASPPPLREKGISLDIEQVVLKALSKEPEQRFESVQAFAQALQQASRLKGISHTGKRVPTSPVTIPVPQFSQPLVQPNNRISRRVILGALAGLAGLMMIGGVNWLSSTQKFHGPTSFKETITSRSTAPSTSELTASSTNTPILTFNHGSGKVIAVAWSPNGQWVASGSSDNTVQVSNATTGDHLLTYKGHSSLVQSVAWSPNNKRIASASQDQTVQVWNAADGSHAYVYHGHADSVWSVAWSSDGTRIASAAGVLSTNPDNSVQVWNASTGTRISIYRRSTGGIFALAWSPDGKRIVFGGYYTQLDVLNASDGSILFTKNGLPCSVTGVTWSPDGSFIASAVAYIVQLWSGSTGLFDYTYQGHTGLVRTVAWSPDGKLIASGGNAFGGGGGMLQVWNPFSSTAIFTYSTRSFFVTSVAWSPDSTRIAAACLDNVVRIWRIR